MVEIVWHRNLSVGAWKYLLFVDKIETYACHTELTVLENPGIFFLLCPFVVLIVIANGKKSVKLRIDASVGSLLCFLLFSFLGYW